MITIMEKLDRLFAIGMVALLGAHPAIAQDTVEPTIGTDLVSSYIWRGQDCGEVSIQPTLGISYKGLSLTAWGSVGLSNWSDTKEFDLTLGYEKGGFNVAITDYWFNAGQDPDNHYFEYHAHKTNHVFEGNLGYDFGPVSFQAFVNFAGNDGVNKDGKRAYSTYLELAAPFKFATCEWEAALGVVPMATTFYNTTGIGLTNISLKATKDIHITDTFSIPLFAQIATNPYEKKAYFVFGLTLQP